MEPLPGLSSSADLNDELMTSLTTFLELYDQRINGFRQVADAFTQTARVREAALAMLLNYGKKVDAVCGGIVGGLWGAFGAVIAAGLINGSEVDATVPFVSSVAAGAAVGALSSFIGCSVRGADVASGRPADRATDGVLWFSAGFVTGGAIGVFGGSLGAAGGAIGGGSAAFHIGRLAADTSRHLNDAEDVKIFELNVCKTLGFTKGMQKAGELLTVVMKPLVDQLETVRKICDKIESSDAVASIAEQTAKTLNAVTTMEKSLCDSQKATDVRQNAEHYKKSLEELEKMRAEVQKVLALLKKN